MSLAKDIVKNYSNELKVELDELSKPLITMLNTLAISGFTAAEFDEPSVNWLEMLNMLLAKNKHIASFYFGANNGNSYFVRAMYKQDIKTRYSAPDTTVLMLEINRNNGQQQYLFFDHKMRRIGSISFHTLNISKTYHLSLVATTKK